MENYNLEKDNVRKIRKEIFDSVTKISGEVENMLDALALDLGDTMVSWNDFRLSKIGQVLFVNDKVSFVKYHEDENTQKFKCYMKAGGLFGIQKHDCLEEVIVEKGHLIELLRSGEEYGVGKIVTYKDYERHKPFAKIESVYDVVFTKKTDLNRMKSLTENDFHKLAREFELSYAQLKAVDLVESGGSGFDKSTGKLIIQFEPVWFKRKAPYTPSGLWSLNKVERQKEEWKAFNDAFRLNANMAMESTSIGRMQVMGFHYKRLGFKTVGEMWDFAKVSEYNQMLLGLRFIASNKKMYNALKNNDWNTFAYYYNGSAYKKYNYHIKLENAYLRSL